MPELPEVETLVLELKERLEGREIQQVKVRDTSVFETPRTELVKRLPGRKIVQIGRLGKYLRLKLSDEWVLWFHLGMTGQLLFDHFEALPSHTHLVLYFSDSPKALLYRDVRRFGRIALTPEGKERGPRGIRRLGPEPSQQDPETFVARCKGRKARIKSLLLNQHFISGLGNIYADESLHRAGIHPRKRSHEVPRGRLIRLHEAIREVLDEAIRWGGSSIDDFLHSDGGRGSFQEFHRVYGRSGGPCRSCGVFIRKIKLAGRSSSFCPHCQPYRSGALSHSAPQPIGA